MADERLPRRAAERASLRRFYLASSLLAYARATGLDDAGLADALGCDLDRLPAVLLCRHPAMEGPMFRADVEAIASWFGLDAGRLGRIIRNASTLVAFSDASPAERGDLLAAARDREPGDRPADRAGTELSPPEPPDGPTP